MSGLLLARMVQAVPAAGKAVFLTKQMPKNRSSITSSDGLKQKQNLGGPMPKRMSKRFKAGWPLAIIDGFWGYRILNWLTWFEPGKGWLWMYKP